MKLEPVAKSDHGSITWLDGWPSSCLLFTEAQLKQAVLEERENCAEICMDYPEDDTFGCAEAIRARKA